MTAKEREWILANVYDCHAPFWLYFPLFHFEKSGRGERKTMASFLPSHSVLT